MLRVSVREYLNTEYGLHFSTEIYGRKRFSTNTYREACFAPTEIFEKSPQAFGRMYSRHPVPRFPLNTNDNYRSSNDNNSNNDNDSSNNDSSNDNDNSSNNDSSNDNDNSSNDGNNVQAESLRYKLLGGLAVRRACYGVALWRELKGSQREWQSSIRIACVYIYIYIYILYIYI